jgi:hypothetical protein
VISAGRGGRPAPFTSDLAGQPELEDKTVATIHHATRKKALDLGVDLTVAEDGTAFYASKGEISVTQVSAKAALAELIRKMEAEKIEGENDPGELNDEDEGTIEGSPFVSDQDPEADEGEGEDEDEDEAKRRASVVKQRYKERYRAQGDETCCGDDLSQIMREATTMRNDKGKDVCDPEMVELIGRDNGINVQERWGHLNVGMQRMNLGNVLRKKARDGEVIKIDQRKLLPEDLGFEAIGEEDED